MNWCWLKISCMLQFISKRINLADVECKQEVMLLRCQLQLAHQLQPCGRIEAKHSILHPDYKTQRALRDDVFVFRSRLTSDSRFWLNARSAMSLQPQIRQKKRPSSNGGHFTRGVATRRQNGAYLIRSLYTRYYKPKSSGDGVDGGNFNRDKTRNLCATRQMRHANKGRVQSGLLYSLSITKPAFRIIV